jgi:hypothetical protein
MTEWRVKVNGNVEPNLVDVEVVINANPYGNRATAYIQDVDGKRAKAYQPRSRVDFEAREVGSGNAYQTILQTFVVEPRERSEGGGDRLEVECHSLDQLIRSGDMNGDLSGLTILSALEQLVKNWMDGVSWDPSRVNPVRPDITLSRSYNNELIDNILKSFARLSGGESYGVVDTGSQLVFEFGPRETETLEGLGPGDITEYDIPQKSQDAINEVRVFYDDGQRSVIVDDSTDKRQLQQRLGADEPVTTAESIMREQITERQAAVAAGEEYLSDRGTPREVTVQSFGLLDAGPGDTIPIRLPRANINDEYVVAQVEWSVPDEATLTAIRKTDIEQKSDSSTSEMLVRASDSLQRVEMRPAQSESNLVEKVRMVETDVGVTVGASGTVGGTNLDTYAILNSGYTALRDAIINQSALSLDTVVLGSDGTDAARPQSGIQSSVGTASASVSTSGSDELTVTASPSVSGDVREVVVQDSTGTPILRATLVSAVSGPHRQR